MRLKGETRVYYHSTTGKKAHARRYEGCLLIWVHFHDQNTHEYFVGFKQTEAYLASKGYVRG